jgi:Fe-S-cluster containining protein
MEITFKCQQCGKCCEEMAICISYSDFKRWEAENRKDILKEISFAEDFPKDTGFYFYKTILEPGSPCPFLKDNLCSIHDTKPTGCRGFPYGVDEVECPQWKPEYLNKKRLKKIKRKQYKDYKKALTHFDEIYPLIVGARFG